MFNTTLNRDEPKAETVLVRGIFDLGKDGPVKASLKLEYADFETLGQARENFSPRGTFSASPFFSTVETVLDGRSQNGGLNSKTNVFNSALNLDIEAGSHIVTLTSGYVHYSSKEKLDVDFTALAILDDTNQGETYDQLSQEIRVTSPGDGPFKYIVGGYYQTSKLSARDDVIFGDFLKTVPAPFIAFRLLGDSRSVRRFRQTSTLWSGFAQATYELTDALSITAGVRINHEAKSGSRNLVIVAGPTNLFPIANVRATWRALRVVEHDISGNISENSTTPMANIQYHLTPDLMVYASYAKGVKAGGFDIRSNSLPTTPSFPGAFIFRPEKADNYEGSVKFQNRSLSLSLSYYNTKYKDLQTSTFDGGIGFNVNNASAAKVRGIEAEGRVRIGDYVKLSGSVAYLDFKFTDFRNGQCPFGLAPNVQPGNFCDYTGTRAQFAPKWTGFAAADFNYPVSGTLELALNVNADFSSKYRSGNVLDPFTDQADYAKLGARLALGTIDDGWEIALVGRNLTNRRIVLTAGQLPLSTTLTGNQGTAYSGIFDRPRNIAVQASIKF